MAATSVPLAASRVEAREAGVPWYVWCCVAAVTSAIVGVQWDIAWHRSVGRDSFWTPAHIAIYLCGVLAGISSGYLILATTFRRSSTLRDSAVRLWGFRGPLGAFIAAWGGIAMLVSAPFDDWWHNAYGLDVEIISPPHALLFLGNGAIQMGSLILILGNMNRAEGELRRKLNWVFLFSGAMLLQLAAIFILSQSFPNSRHSAFYYRVVCTMMPFVLVGVGRASHQRWACTKMAAIFTLTWMAAIWILPLFPAEPKLGPVFNKVTHFIPPPVPILLLAPAILLDVLLEVMKDKLAGRRAWLQSFAAGLAFLGALIAVEWPFASFMLSPAARNGWFGAHYFDYNSHPNGALRNFRFIAHDQTSSDFWMNMLLAAVLAVLMSRLGMLWGDSMRRVRR